jgi:hypothetical protein
MSELPTKAPVDEEVLSIEENRRILGVQVAANLVAQQNEGIEELLTYADQIEKFLEAGLVQKTTFGEHSEA